MAAFALVSSAFEHAELILTRYSCDGDDLSPPLRWANVPEPARSLALLVDEPTLLGACSRTGWRGGSIQRRAGGLGEGEAAPSERAKRLRNVGYRGPCPSARHGRHRYVFRLYALDRDLHLDPGALRGEYTDA
jgi:Raf kinase inhibitor-like YbhB/YbcL family protein